MGHVQDVSDQPNVVENVSTFLNGIRASFRQDNAMCRQSLSQNSKTPIMDPESKFSIATWNVCLGIANKKDTVTDTLNLENISVCCLQETEIIQDFPEEILNCNNFVLELEIFRVCNPFFFFFSWYFS